VPSALVCEVCHRPLHPGYRLRGGALRCGRHAPFYRPVLRRSLITALVVGTVLTAINQGDRLVRGDVTAMVLLKMGLTYCVPFLVSTSGALGVGRLDPPPISVEQIDASAE
jgi:hypothetical protein